MTEHEEANSIRKGCMEVPMNEAPVAEVLAQALDHVQDGVLLLVSASPDEAVRVAYANAPLLQKIGANHSILGKPLAELTDPESIAPLEAILQAQESGSVILGLKSTTGNPWMAEWKIEALPTTPHSDPPKTYWVATLRDNVESIRREEALKQKLADRTKDLENFTYIVSHDFRGPLRAIMSASMILIEDYGDRLDDEGRSELRRQSNAAKKLASLLEDILKISRLGRQEVSLESVDVSRLATEVAQEVSQKAGREDVEVSIQEGLTASADPKLVRQLLQALIENSVKFGPPAASRCVRIEVGRDERSFFVKDNGIGFDHEHAERIFLPFERLHREGEYPGTGIGLTNAKQIVDKHDGKIEAEARPGEGATFRFTL